MVKGAMRGEARHTWRGGYVWQRGRALQIGDMCGERGGMCGKGGGMQAGETAAKAGGMHPTGMHSCYQLQRSWAKVIFSQACVKNSVHRGGGGGCLPQCMLGYPPCSRHPPGSKPPWSRHPPGSRPPPGADTPREHTPPQSSPPAQAHPDETQNILLFLGSICLRY